MNTPKINLTIGVLSLALIIASCKPDIDRLQNHHYKNNVRKVFVEKLIAIRDPFPIHTSGVLASKEEVSLSFKTGGIIRELKVEEGDKVKKAQLLATLDLSEIDAQVTKARNAFKKAERDLQRIRGLYKDSSATLEEDQLKATVFVPDSSSEKAAIKFVKPLYLGDDFFAVAASELNGNHRVITHGSSFLRDKELIQIANNESYK